MSGTYRTVYHTCPRCRYEDEIEGYLDDSEIEDIFYNREMSILPFCDNLVEDGNIEDIVHAIKDAMDKSPYIKDKVMSIIKEWV